MAMAETGRARLPAMDAQERGKAAGGTRGHAGGDGGGERRGGRPGSGVEWSVIRSAVAKCMLYDSC